MMKNKIKILKNKSLKNFSTFKIGGRAKYFTTVKNRDELLAVLKYVSKNKIPFKVFGGGSNVVFGDGLLNYFFIRVYGGNIKFNKNILEVDAGVLLSDVVKIAVKRGLKGLENLTGIPGTVGGAIYGNAGAFGSCFSDVVKKVEIWDGKKNFWVSKNFCKFDYRSSVFKKKKFVILKAQLVFKKEKKDKLLNVYRNISHLRKRKYSNNLKCPGSFFKNVLVKNVSKSSLSKIDSSKIVDNKIPAGYLLEKVGVKGKDFGVLKISNSHANLIINKGKATIKDVKRLSSFLKKKVKDKFGILLEEEVVYIE